MTKDKKVTVNNLIKEIYSYAYLEEFARQSFIIDTLRGRERTPEEIETAAKWHQERRERQERLDSELEAIKSLLKEMEPVDVVVSSELLLDLIDAYERDEDGY